MDKEKVLPSDSGKVHVTGGEKRLVSEEETVNVPVSPSDEKPPQVETTTNSRKERIRKSTADGGLKIIPENFTQKDGDWVVIKSDNPFDVLYLDYEQYKNINSAIVRENYEVLNKFWEEKISLLDTGSGQIRDGIIEKYGGKDIRQYKTLLKQSYEKLNSSIENCFLEIDDKRREAGERQLESTISGIFADHKYEPTEKDTVFLYGWKTNLKDNEITEILIKYLEANGFYPLEKIKDGANDNEKLSVVWVTKDYKEEDKKEPKKILEQDFVAATKRDKTLNINTANFLYDKGADLGVDNSTAIDLIKKWGDQYRVDIEDGIPKIEIDNGRFELSGMEFHSTASRSFTISNTGAGTLTGTIKVLTETNKPWLKVERKNVDTSNEQEISFKVDTSVLDYGNKDTGKIEIQSNGGTASIEVKISIQEAIEYIKRFRNKLTAAALLLGGLFGYFIYSLNLVDGMNANVTNIAGVIALISSILFSSILFIRKIGVGWGIFLFIAVLIAIPQLAEHSPHGLSTVAWALTYGAIADISAKSIWKAQRRGDKKVPIVAGIGVVALSALVIIIGTTGSIPFLKSAPPVQYNLTIASNNANIRKSPSEFAGIIAKLTKGVNIGVLDTQGKWCKVQYYNASKKKTEVGWVHQSLLTPRGTSNKIGRAAPIVPPSAQSGRTLPAPTESVRVKRKTEEQQSSMSNMPTWRTPPVSPQSVRGQAKTEERQSSINYAPKTKERFDKDIPLLLPP